MILSLVIFTYCDLQAPILNYEIGRIFNVYTYDFIRINDKISGEGRYIYLTDGVPYAPYAPGFYLSDHYLTSLEIADYVISSNSNLLPDLLTPENERMFLFKK